MINETLYKKDLLLNSTDKPGSGYFSCCHGTSEIMDDVAYISMSNFDSTVGLRLRDYDSPQVYIHNLRSIYSTLETYINTMIEAGNEGTASTSFLGCNELRRRGRFECCYETTDDDFFAFLRLTSGGYTVTVMPEVPDTIDDFKTKVKNVMALLKDFIEHLEEYFNLPKPVLPEI